MCDKITNNLIQLLKCKNHANILLYNLDNHTFFINCLKQIYDIHPDKIIIENDIQYKKNNVYYDIDVSNITYKNRNNLISILKHILYSNYCPSQKKIIILNNFTPNTIFQNILKVIVEKNHHVVFIIICKKLTNVISAIKSRFINIRVPNISSYTKYKCLNNTIKIKDFNKHKNLPNEYIDYLSLTNTIKSNNILDDIVNRLFIIYDLDSKVVIKNIKELSYILACINIPITILLKYIIDKIINKVEIVNRQIYKCIYFISDFEYKYNKSYYKMLHYEKLFINIYNIIST